MGIVAILGTLHTDELRTEFNYSLDLLKDIILDFSPDIICGEIRPEDWEMYIKDKNYSGYLGPSEYRKIIIPLCEERNIEFVPVDWFETDLVNLDHFKDYSKSDIERFDRELEKKYESIFELANQTPIPFNSVEVNKLVSSKHSWLNEKNPVVQNINWISRNQIMIERVKNSMRKNKGKKTLCTIGFEHLYFYYEELIKKNCDVVFPIR